MGFDPDLCDACAVLYQLSYQINWELVIMWVNDKPVESGYMRSNKWNFINLIARILKRDDKNYDQCHVILAHRHHTEQSDTQGVLNSRVQYIVLIVIRFLIFDFPWQREENGNEDSIPQDTYLIMYRCGVVFRKLQVWGIKKESNSYKF